VTASTGVVYLLHFDQPYRHARHYIGWTTDLDARLAAHALGRGARLVEVINAAGIGWRLARTWPGGRKRERQLKKQGGASGCCPCCGVRPREPRVWTARDRRRIARRWLRLVDLAWMTDPAGLNRVDRHLKSLLVGQRRPVTAGDVIAWMEGPHDMNLLTYTTPYVRADGSVWCMQEDGETGCENACRLVVDTETGLSLFLPDYLINVNASVPASAQTGEAWPLFRWATQDDLHIVESDRSDRQVGDRR
jgi:predicted GIY-YIG superfamily endonuclease